MGIVELSNISKIYRMGENRLSALKSINLELKKGEFVSILGQSGSGKSTLLNIIGGLDRPTEGKVFVAGLNISTLNDKQISHFRNQTIGFVFQNFNLQPPLTALENVMLPLIYSRIKRNDRMEIAQKALERVGLENRMNHKPGELSGGQCQRVCIARAIVTKSDIILADEPTGNLDRNSGEMIMNLLEELNKSGYTIIMVTHNSDQAARTTRTVQMVDGMITKDNIA